jgi:hypothetical protein
MFEEYFINPKLDPDALTNYVAWKAKYWHLPEHERENPPAGYEDYEHLYPATDKEKEFLAAKAEFSAERTRELAGVPKGPWLSKDWNDRLRERQGR